MNDVTLNNVASILNSKTKLIIYFGSGAVHGKMSRESDISKILRIFKAASSHTAERIYLSSSAHKCSKKSYSMRVSFRQAFPFRF